MSNNDCISRSELYEQTAAWEAEALHMVEMHMNDEDTTEWRKWSTILAERSAFKLDVAKAPAVPQEMSAREFVIAHHRMCQSKMECVECRICHDDREPRSCAVLMGLNPDDTVTVVGEWAREHPGRSEK